MSGGDPEKGAKSAAGVGPEEHEAPIEPLPDDLVAALAAPGFWAETGDAEAPRVEHVQTHISHVFLVGDHVYKLKKAVRFQFLDFGTRDRRRFFCGEDLRLNRRLAAPVYVDVLTIVRRADGTFALGGPLDGATPGAVVEPILHMRRLPAARLLPALLAAGSVDASMMAALAERIAAFHRGAPSGPAVAAHASPAALRRRFEDILATLRPFVGDVLEADEHAALAATSEWFVAYHAALFRARQAAGRVREGHGDLHAEHVCFVDGAGGRARGATVGAARDVLPPGIYVFDCIEFSEPFRCNDVASEVAFLTMDLEMRGRRDLAEAFAAAYVTVSGDRELSILVPYYAAFRATVRATVAALTSVEAEVADGERAAARARAERYVALALRSAWRAGDPVLVVCCGRSGTGKSTLAAALAELTDATVLRSDVIRKHEPGPVAAAAGARDARYTRGARAAVYAELLRAVEGRLAAGETVIADATFLARADRDAAAAVAARHGRRIVFVETVAAEASVAARLGARRSDDVSEARFDTYLAQGAAADPWGSEEPRLVVATDDGLPARVRARAMRALLAWRRAGA